MAKAEETLIQAVGLQLPECEEAAWLERVALPLAKRKWGCVPLPLLSWHLPCVSPSQYLLYNGQFILCVCVCDSLSPSHSTL